MNNFNVLNLSIKFQTYTNDTDIIKREEGGGGGQVGATGHLTSLPSTVGFFSPAS